MSEILQELSSGLAGVVETVGAGLIRVEARRRLPASGIAWTEDGIIVTANHVVRRDEGIVVGFADGSSAEAALVGRDPTTDLAVLRTAGTPLAVPTWADPDDLRVGHIVLALGRPGRTAQATFGVVSAFGYEWRTPAGGTIDRYLQTDVVMYPGFSGGPLVDVAGQVRGLNTSALLRGVSVSLPTTAVRAVVDSIMTHGRVRRGYLGIGGQAVQLPDEIGSELEQETGVLLVSVESGSPAAKGGLLLGDTIVRFGSERVRHLDDLLTLLGGDLVDQEVAVRILRGGSLQEVTVTVGERT